VANADEGLIHEINSVVVPGLLQVILKLGKIHKFDETMVRSIHQKQEASY
jgi:hypothetical protein